MIGNSSLDSKCTSNWRRQRNSLLLQKRFGKFYRIQDLGFPKLKNFLLQLSDRVELTRSSNNHIKVALRKGQPGHAVSLDHFGTHSRTLSETVDRKSAAKELPPLGNLVGSGKARRDEGGRTTTPRSEGVGRGLDPYCFGHETGSDSPEQAEVLHKVERFVLKMVQRSVYGVEARRLEEALSDYLGSQFDSQAFGAPSFVHFLQSHFRRSLEVSLKNSLRSKRTNSLTKEFVVYLKPEAQDALPFSTNFTFGSFDLPRSEGQDLGRPTDFRLAPLASHRPSPADRLGRIPTSSIYSDKALDRSTDHKDSRSLNQSKRFNAEAHIEQVFDINDNHIFINSRANSQADNDHSPDCSDP